MTKELIILLIPVILLQAGLAIYCITKILKEGVEIGNKALWIVIVLIVNLFGPIAFLIIGRKKYVND